MSDQGATRLMFDRQWFSRTESLLYRQNHPLNDGAAVLFIARLFALSEETVALQPWVAESPKRVRPAWVRESS